MVVYIITKLELGGAQKVCLSLIHGLHDNNQPVSLISGNEGILVGEAQKFSNVYLLPTMKREVRLKGFFAEIKNFFQLIKTLKKINKSTKDLIVHTHSTKAGILGRWAALFAGIRHRVHTVHGFGFNAYQSWPTWLVIYMLELVTSLITNHVVCVSENDRRIGSKLFPLFNKKSSVIRAAVDTQVFLPATKLPRHKQFTIGTVSCFKPQKNLFDLLRAFKYVYTEACKRGLPIPHLEIIGGGTLQPDIETWISQQKLTSAISLLGWQHKVAEFMDGWDLYAMSSLWEGLPCSIVEARLKRLPVVAYQVDGIPEVVINGKNGFLENPGDWQALADRMLELVENKKLHEQLSNFNDNLGDFDTKIMVKKHLELYQTFKASP